VVSQGRNATTGRMLKRLTAESVKPLKL
jgi:hypothetical protein